MDYVFYASYLQFSLVATNAQRVEIVAPDKLRMFEWQQRVRGYTKEGQCEATTMALVSHKTAPNVLHVVIMDKDVALYEHYVAALRPVFATSIDAEMGDKAPFFVNLMGRGYAKPSNAITRFLRANQVSGEPLFSFTTIRHLAATKNSRFRLEDPQKYAATCVVMGHSGRTQRRNYNEDRISDAIRGHHNIDHMFHEPSSEDDGPSASAMEKPRPDAHLSKKVTKQVKRSAEREYGEKFFRQFPVSCHNTPSITAEDAVAFAKTHRQLRDKYRYAQRVMREDVLAYLIGQRRLTEKEAFYYLQRAQEDWGWWIRSEMVVKKVSTMAQSPLAPDDDRRLAVLAAELAEMANDAGGEMLKENMLTVCKY